MAVVQAWQNGALSRDSMLDIFRLGEALPEGRTNEEEARLIAVRKPEPGPSLSSQVARQDKRAVSVPSTANLES